MNDDDFDSIMTGYQQEVAFWETCIRDVSNVRQDLSDFLMKLDPDDSRTEQLTLAIERCSRVEEIISDVFLKGGSK